MSLNGGGASLTADHLQDIPVTMLTIGVCCALWFYLWNYDVSIEKFGYQYERVTVHKEWWRMISASYAHQAPMHIMFNMISLWNSAVMEVLLGSVTYLKYTFLLVILSMVTVTVFYFVAQKYFNRPEYRVVYSLGYSCVVFGWMMIQCEYSRGDMSYFGFTVPARLAPFLALIITSIIVPNASFIGHLSGIIVGEFIAQRFFFWFYDPLFWVMFLLTFLGAGYTAYLSLYDLLLPPWLQSSTTSSDPSGRAGGWLRLSPNSDEESGTTEMKVVNGVLTRVPRS